MSKTQPEFEPFDHYKQSLQTSSNFLDELFRDSLGSAKIPQSDTRSTASSVKPSPEILYATCFDPAVTDDRTAKTSGSGSEFPSYSVWQALWKREFGGTWNNVLNFALDVQRNDRKFESSIIWRIDHFFQGKDKDSKLIDELRELTYYAHTKRPYGEKQIAVPAHISSWSDSFRYIEAIKRYESAHSTGNTKNRNDALADLVILSHGSTTTASIKAKVENYLRDEIKKGHINDNDIGRATVLTGERTETINKQFESLETAFLGRPAHDTKISPSTIRERDLEALERFALKNFATGGDDKRLQIIQEYRVLHELLVLRDAKSAREFAIHLENLRRLAETGSCAELKIPFNPLLHAAKNPILESRFQDLFHGSLNKRDEAWQYLKSLLPDNATIGNLFNEYRVKAIVRKLPDLDDSAGPLSTARSDLERAKTELEAEVKNKNEYARDWLAWIDAKAELLNFSRDLFADIQAGKKLVDNLEKLAAHNNHARQALVGLVAGTGGDYRWPHSQYELHQTQPALTPDLYLLSESDAASVRGRALGKLQQLFASPEIKFSISEYRALTDHYGRLLNAENSVDYLTGKQFCNTAANIKNMLMYAAGDDAARNKILCGITESLCVRPPIEGRRQLIDLYLELLGSKDKNGNVRHSFNQTDIQWVPQFGNHPDPDCFHILAGVLSLSSVGLGEEKVKLISLKPAQSHDLIRELLLRYEVAGDQGGALATMGSLIGNWNGQPPPELMKEVKAKLHRAFDDCLKDGKLVPEKSAQYRGVVAGMLALGAHCQREDVDKLTTCLTPELATALKNLKHLPPSLKDRIISRIFDRLEKCEPEKHDPEKGGTDEWAPGLQSIGNLAPFLLRSDVEKFTNIGDRVRKNATEWSKSELARIDDAYKKALAEGKYAGIAGTDAPFRQQQVEHAFAQALFQIYNDANPQAKDEVVRQFLNSNLNLPVEYRQSLQHTLSTYFSRADANAELKVKFAKLSYDGGKQPSIADVLRLMGATEDQIKKKDLDEYILLAGGEDKFAKFLTRLNLFNHLPSDVQEILCKEYGQAVAFDPKTRFHIPLKKALESLKHKKPLFLNSEEFDTRVTTIQKALLTMLGQLTGPGRDPEHLRYSLLGKWSQANRPKLISEIHPRSSNLPKTAAESPSLYKQVGFGVSGRWEELAKIPSTKVIRLKQAANLQKVEDMIAAGKAAELTREELSEALKAKTIAGRDMVWGDWRALTSIICPVGGVAWARSNQRDKLNNAQDQLIKLGKQAEVTSQMKTLEMHFLETKIQAIEIYQQEQKYLMLIDEGKLRDADELAIGMILTHGSQTMKALAPNLYQELYGKLDKQGPKALRLYQLGLSSHASLPQYNYNGTDSAFKLALETLKEYKTLPATLSRPDGMPSGTQLGQDTERDANLAKSIQAAVLADANSALDSHPTTVQLTNLANRFNAHSHRLTELVQAGMSGQRGEAFVTELKRSATELQQELEKIQNLLPQAKQLRNELQNALNSSADQSARTILGNRLHCIDMMINAFCTDQNSEKQSPQVEHLNKMFKLIDSGDLNETTFWRQFRDDFVPLIATLGVCAVACVAIVGTCGAGTPLAAALIAATFAGTGLAIHEEWKELLYQINCTSHGSGIGDAVRCNLGEFGLPTPWQFISGDRSKFAVYNPSKNEFEKITFEHVALNYGERFLEDFAKCLLIMESGAAFGRLLNFGGAPSKESFLKLLVDDLNELKAIPNRTVRNLAIRQELLVNGATGKLFSGAASELTAESSTLLKSVTGEIGNMLGFAAACKGAEDLSGANDEFSRLLIGCLIACAHRGITHSNGKISAARARLTVDAKTKLPTVIVVTPELEAFVRDLGSRMAEKGIGLKIWQVSATEVRFPTPAGVHVRIVLAPEVTNAGTATNSKPTTQTENPQQQSKTTAITAKTDGRFSVTDVPKTNLAKPQNLPTTDVAANPTATQPLSLPKSDGSKNSSQVAIQPKTMETLSAERKALQDRQLTLSQKLAEFKLTNSSNNCPELRIIQGQMLENSSKLEMNRLETMYVLQSELSPLRQVLRNQLPLLESEIDSNRLNHNNAKTVLKAEHDAARRRLHRELSDNLIEQQVYAEKLTELNKKESEARKQLDEQYRSKDRDLTDTLSRARAIVNAGPFREASGAKDSSAKLDLPLLRETVAKASPKQIAVQDLLGLMPEGKFFLMTAQGGIPLVVQGAGSIPLQHAMALCDQVCNRVAALKKNQPLPRQIEFIQDQQAGWDGVANQGRFGTIKINFHDGTSRRFTYDHEYGHIFEVAVIKSNATLDNKIWDVYRAELDAACRENKIGIEAQAKLKVIDHIPPDQGTDLYFLSRSEVIAESCKLYWVEQDYIARGEKPPSYQDLVEKYVRSDRRPAMRLFEKTYETLKKEAFAEQAPIPSNVQKSAGKTDTTLDATSQGRDPSTLRDPKAQTQEPLRAQGSPRDSGAQSTSENGSTTAKSPEAEALQKVLLKKLRGEGWPKSTATKYVQTLTVDGLKEALRGLDNKEPRVVFIGGKPIDPEHPLGRDEVTNAITALEIFASNAGDVVNIIEGIPPDALSSHKRSGDTAFYEHSQNLKLDKLTKEPRIYTVPRDVYAEIVKEVCAEHITIVKDPTYGSEFQTIKPGNEVIVGRKIIEALKLRGIRPIRPGAG